MLAKRSRQHYALIWRNSMEGRAMIGGRRHILRWLDEFGECWLPLEGLTDREFARELALALRREHYAADGTVRRRCHDAPRHRLQHHVRVMHRLLGGRARFLANRGGPDRSYGSELGNPSGLRRLAKIAPPDSTQHTKEGAQCGAFRVSGLPAPR